MKILNGLNNGLKNGSLKDKLFDTAKGIAQSLSKLLTVSPTLTAGVAIAKNALPGHKSGLDYVPRDNYVARLHKGERVLTKEENEDYTEAENQSKKNTYNPVSKKKEEVLYSRDIDYEKMSKMFLKALNSCKIQLDREGFVRFIDNRLLEVM